MSSINSPQGSQRSSAGDTRDALPEAGQHDKGGLQSAADEARKAAAGLGEQGKAIADDVRRSAQEAADGIRREAQSLAETAAKDARDVAEQGKGRMAAQMATVGAAINRAAEDLEHHGQPMLASYARHLGQGVEQASHTVHEKQVEDLIGMVGDFARRQPAMFIGGAALLGFLASRFAKSSAQHVHNAGADATSRQPLTGQPAIREPWPIASGAARSASMGRGSPTSSLPSQGGLS